MNKFFGRILSFLILLLPPDLRVLWFGEKEFNTRATRELFFSEEERHELGVAVKAIAVEQGRTEREVYRAIIQNGVSQVVSRKYHIYKRKFDSLTTREKQVAVLTKLDCRSYEIAEFLGLSYDTVRSHSKKIYKKFGLSNNDSHQARNELRRILNDLNKEFDLQEWWDTHHST